MARTGEKIYKRKDGRWEARYISSYNADGKAKYKYLYARTYAEVKTKLIRVQNSVETKVEVGKIGDREKYESWLFEWLHSKRIRIKDSTYIRYRNVIENHINPKLGMYPINKISTPLMERFVSNKLNSGRLDGNGGLSPKTMSDMLTIIKESFKLTQLPTCYLRFVRPPLVDKILGWLGTIILSAATKALIGRSPSDGCNQ